MSADSLTGKSNVVILSVCYRLQPFLHEAFALGVVRTVDPEAGTVELAVRNQALGIGLHAGNAGRGAGDHRADVLSFHCRAVLEEVGLHDGGHLAVPEGSHQDYGVVIPGLLVHVLEGGITGCLAGSLFDGVDQVAAEFIVIGIVVGTLIDFPDPELVRLLQVG